MHIHRGAWAEINLDAIAHNVQFARSGLKPETRYCAVVKANAYGHGAVRVAQEAVRNGASFLAVALVQEGVELRDAGLEVPILVLGALAPEAAELAVQYNLSHAVFDKERLDVLNAAALKLGRKAKIHIKIDTGMHRIGVKVKDAGSFARLAAAMPGIYIEGAFSHFATADAENKDYAKEQYTAFMEAMALIEREGIKIPVRHICNSAGLTELKEYQLDMVRQGISLYGMPPDHTFGVYEQLEPVMTLKAQISYVKTLEAGASIGYGRSYTLKRPTVVATIPIGYADGVNRRLSNTGYMLVHGAKAPIIGRVCMDQCMLDVTDIPGVKVGDEVIVFGGKNPSVELVAELAGTICHEITCNVSARIPRVYVRNK